MTGAQPQQTRGLKYCQATSITIISMATDTNEMPVKVKLGLQLVIIFID